MRSAQETTAEVQVADCGICGATDVALTWKKARPVLTSHPHRTSDGITCKGAPKPGTFSNPVYNV